MSYHKQGDHIRCWKWDTLVGQGWLFRTDWISIAFWWGRGTFSILTEYLQPLDHDLPCSGQWKSITLSLQFKFHCHQIPVDFFFFPLSRGLYLQGPSEGWKYATEQGGQSPVAFVSRELWSFTIQTVVIRSQHNRSIVKTFGLSYYS